MAKKKADPTPAKPAGDRNKTVASITHDADKRKNIPTAEYQSVVKQEQQNPVRVAYERRNRDLDPQFVCQVEGRAGLERSGCPCPAALYPGESSSQGLDCRLA